MYKTIVTNAGSLRVGDVVFWERQRITEIHNQTDSSCDCTLVSADGSTRRHTVSSANTLVVVRDGPTLDAANAAGSLYVQPSGLPVYRREVRS